MYNKILYSGLIDYCPMYMLKSYFYHNSTERKATAFLLILIALLWGLSWAWGYFVSVEKVDFTDFKAEVQAFEGDIALSELLAAEERDAAYKQKYRKSYYSSDFEEDSPPYHKKKYSKDNEPKVAVVAPFPFDPNIASETELLSLGLSNRTVHSIINYREKGGIYRIKADFGKIYTLEATDYARLASFLQLPDTLERRQYAASKTFEPREKAAPIIIDINKATAEDFQKLRGIGASFATRIVKYRNALGGFAKLEQIGEVYGFPDSVFLKIRPQLICSAPHIQKININTANAELLKTHPYLRWRHANAIVRYREQNGLYKSVEMLRTLMEFDDAEGTYWKVKDYLTVE